MLINEIPKEPAVRREWIKYQLRLKGYSLRGLGREYGYSGDNAIAALKRPYPKWERIIAEKLGLLPHELWSERYDPDGRPNRHSYLYPRKSQR